MEICTTSQFLCSLKYPESRLRTMHNISCAPETFLCDKHIAMMEGCFNGVDMLFYGAITANGLRVVREAAACATKIEYCDIRIVEEEILYSGLGKGCSPLIMESIPEGIKLSEAIYTFSQSRLDKGLKEFKARLKRLDISHNNLRLRNIIIDCDNIWHTVCNYGISHGFGGDKESFTAIERKIERDALPDNPTEKMREQQHLYNIITDDEGHTIYPIVESRRRFTSQNGVGFKNKNGDIVIADEYLTATDFCSNRSVVQLKSGKMGIIDRKGRYIIEPKYSSINFNPTNGISIVRDGELEIRFDYCGKQIEE